MPTNILRQRNTERGNINRASRKAVSAVPQAARFASLRAGSVTLRLELLPTKTAELIWRALPIFSVCETWGACIHFECPIKAGRERTARLNVTPGDVCYWSEDDRVMLAWGPGFSAEQLLFQW